MQQSAFVLQLPEGKAVLQLSDPHFRVPLHSESSSQSPPPSRQGLEEEQQLQSVELMPLHWLEFSVAVAASDAKCGKLLQILITGIPIYNQNFIYFRNDKYLT